MAIYEYALRLLRDVLTEQTTDPACRRHMAMFGCHDIIVRPEDVASMFGDVLSGPLHLRSDAAEILNWHKAHDVTSEIVDTSALFASLGLGWGLCIYDLVKARGCEIVHDLNFPFDAPEHESFDVVYDGVLSQVFNIAQCMWSAAELLRVGGVLISMTVANKPNHGFYSVSPTFYTDFLLQNEFKILRHEIIMSIQCPVVVPFDPINTCQLPHGSVHIVVAKKTRSSLVFPRQSKFINRPMSVR